MERISIDPQICHGQPCIRGTRVMVSLILQFLSNGDTPEAILAEYPTLNQEDIHAALAYAAELMTERVVTLEAPSAA